MNSESLSTPAQSSMPEGNPDVEPTSPVPEGGNDFKSGSNDVDCQNGASPEIDQSAQPVTRVDDPLEAMDALEDAIEEVGQALPTVDENADLDPPSSRSSIDEEPGKPNEAAGPAVAANEAAPPQKTSPGSRTSSMSHAKPTQPGTSNPQTRASLARRTSSNAGDAKASLQNMSRRTSQSSVASKTPTTRSTGSQGSSSVGKLSVHKPGFVPAKSTKPPTRPTFELPGEAISRRKRAEREERLRREEEELRRRRSFKASGIRYSMGPSTQPRETATSRARTNRMSLALDSKPNGHIGRSNASTPTNKDSLGRASSVRGSRPTSPTKRQSLVARTQSMSGVKTTAATSKVRGKEVLQRDSTPSGRENDRREKEEMAKRARAEAAERSRQLSRQWAEKQKLKQKAAKQSTNDSTKQTPMVSSDPFHDDQDCIRH